MAIVRPAIVLAILACYIAGMTTSLFGPAWGSFLGVVAFVANWILMVVWIHQFRQGTIIPLTATVRIAIWIRPLVWGLMILSVAVFGAAFVTEAVASQDAGVAQGTGPIFQVRTEYLLNQHGVFTPVTQTRYRVVGTCFVVAWHSFGMLFALLGVASCSLRPLAVWIPRSQG